MYEDIVKHCQECASCQQAKLPSPSKAPLVNEPIGQPWQMVAVDVLAVPSFLHLLVIQDYFTKWVEAIPLPDQTTTWITNALVQVFNTYGMPEILHSDQEKNFESTLLQQTLATFGIHKSRNTVYHPERDGMVERYNRFLLQMQAYWEEYLPLMLFAYRTAAHTSTGISPSELTFGRSPHVRITTLDCIRHWYLPTSTTYQLRRLLIKIPVPYNQEMQCGYLFQQQGS